MSGDNLHGNQPIKFYSAEGKRRHAKVLATHAMNEIKEARWHNTNYIIEIESMFVNSRYRTGSPMQE